MCPTRRTTTRSSRPRPSQSPNPLPSHQPRTHRHTRQPSMWDFINPHMPPVPTAAPEPPNPLNPPTLDAPIPSTPPARLPLPHTTLPNDDPLLQRTLHNDRSNDPWGDVESYSDTPECFRVVSKNVSTLSPTTLDMTAMATELQRSNTSVFLAQETNTSWQPAALQSIHGQCAKVH